MRNYEMLALMCTLDTGFVLLHPQNLEQLAQWQQNVQDYQVTRYFFRLLYSLVKLMKWNCCRLVSWMSSNSVSTHSRHQLAATWVNTTR